MRPARPSPRAKAVKGGGIEQVRVVSEEPTPVRDGGEIGVPTEPTPRATSLFAGGGNGVERGGPTGATGADDSGRDGSTRRGGEVAKEPGGRATEAPKRRATPPLDVPRPEVRDGA